MKWSCRLEVLPGDSVGAKLSNAAAFGFDQVALPGRYLGEYLDELRACLPDLPLTFSSLSLGFSGSLLSPDEAVRRTCRESLVRLFDLCAELGVPAVNMPPVLIPDNPVRLSDAAAQDALLREQLPGVCDEAAARSVMLCLEPVNVSETDYMTGVAHAARICREVAHAALGITVDFFHMYMEETDIPAVLREAASCIGLVHVAERESRVEPQPGTADLTAGFAALTAARYDHVIEIECRSLSGRGEEVLPRSLAWMKEVWGG